MGSMQFSGTTTTCNIKKIFGKDRRTDGQNGRTDGHGYIESSTGDKQYIFNIYICLLRCKLLTEIIIPSERV